MVYAFRFCNPDFSAGFRSFCQCGQHGPVSASMGAENANMVCARLGATYYRRFIPGHLSYCPCPVSWFVHLAGENVQSSGCWMERDHFEFCHRLRTTRLQYVAGAFFVSLTDKFADGGPCYTAGRNRCGSDHLRSARLGAFIQHASIRLDPFAPTDPA